MSSKPAPNTPRAAAPVDTARDGVAVSRAEQRGVGTSGGDRVTSEAAQSPAARPKAGFPAWVAYAMVAAGTVATCLVNAFSASHDLGRVGRTVPFWQPLSWELSSGVLIIALAPLIRHAVVFSTKEPIRPAVVVPLHLGLALVFSALHVLGMVALRKLAYALAGSGPYVFDFSAANLLYELRKDVLVYLLIASVFWLMQRLSDKAVAAAAKVAAPVTLAPEVDDVWLRDGAVSIRLDPREVVWVASAGNYVEYCLASGQRHLIRATLRTEEERLARFGIVRVHRTKLVNTNRIKRLSVRPSGDFEVEMGSGEVVAGSRRYRSSIATLGPA